MKKSGLVLFFCVVFTLVAIPLHAGTVTKPHAFTSGTVAKSAEVNENFDTLYDEVNRRGSVMSWDDVNDKASIGSNVGTNPGLLIRKDQNDVTGISVVNDDTGLDASAALRLFSITGGGDPFIEFGQGSGGPEWTVGVDNSDNDKFKISGGVNQVWPSLLTESTHLTILKTGNVGIGTTTPTEKLTVNGTIESKSGGIKFPDGTTQISAASDSVNFDCGLASRSTASGTGTFSISHGLGKTPKIIRVHAMAKFNGVLLSQSNGYATSTNHQGCNWWETSSGDGNFISSTDQNNTQIIQVFNGSNPTSDPLIRIEISSINSTEIEFSVTNIQTGISGNNFICYIEWEVEG